MILNQVNLQMLQITNMIKMKIVLFFVTSINFDFDLLNYIDVDENGFDDLVEAYGSLLNESLKFKTESLKINNKF